MSEKVRRLEEITSLLSDLDLAVYDYEEIPDLTPEEASFLKVVAAFADYGRDTMFGFWTKAEGDT